MSKKVLIIVSNAHVIGPHNRRTGIFLPEVAHPYAEFDKAKYQIDFASLTGDTPFLDALNLADDPDNLELGHFVIRARMARTHVAAPGDKYTKRTGHSETLSYPGPSRLPFAPSC